MTTTSSLQQNGNTRPEPRTSELLHAASTTASPWLRSVPATRGVGTFSNSCSSLTAAVAFTHLQNSNSLNQQHFWLEDSRRAISHRLQRSHENFGGPVATPMLADASLMTSYWRDTITHQRFQQGGSWGSKQMTMKWKVTQNTSWWNTKGLQQHWKRLLGEPQGAAEPAVCCSKWEVSVTKPWAASLHG